MKKTASCQFHNLLESPAPGDALKAALRYGGLTSLPFLQYAPDIPAGPVPYHSGSVLAHLARCMNEVAGDILAVWMAMVHDCGKLTTPRNLWPHHYGHESRGETLSAIWSDALGLDERYRAAGIMAAGLHMRASRYLLLRPGKKLKLLMEIWASPFAVSFLRVVDADSRSRLGKVITAHHSALQAAGELDDNARITLLMELARKSMPRRSR